MTDIAKHIRIFNSNADDDYVSKRVTAINSIATTIKKKVKINDILEFSNEIILSLENSSSTRGSINDIAVSALKKSSTSFVADEEQLQILTCTLLGTMQYLEKAQDYKNVSSPVYILAIALWSGLSFQKPIKNKERLEILRMELLAKASKIVEDISIKSRDRKITNLRTGLIPPAANTFVDFIPSVENSYGILIDAMRLNAILDREEIDILWWVLAGWSNTCKVQISTLNSVQTALIASFEIGKLLKRFPAIAHTHLSCRGVQHNEEFSCAEIIEQMGELSLLMANDIKPQDLIKNNSKIFVVCNLLIEGNGDHYSDSKRPIFEWAARILLELSLLNINSFNE